MTNAVSKKTKYFSVQSKPFEGGDVLLFDLYIAVEKKVYRIHNRGDALEEKHLAKLQAASKIYMLTEEYEAFKQYFYEKKTSRSPKEISLDSVAESLQSHLRHIFCNRADAKSIQKLYPLVSQLATFFYSNTLKVQQLMHLIEKDYFTYSHSLNVAIYAALLGQEIGLEKSELQKLILSAMLHDIGKTKIDEKILYKKEPLNTHEHKIIKMHATMGFVIAKNAGIMNKNILSGIHHHHERLDGSGYPNGFKGEYISLFARIIGICDTYAAMSSNRVYQDPKKPFEILTEMKKELAGKLDSELINQFIKVLV